MNSKLAMAVAFAVGVSAVMAEDSTNSVPPQVATTNLAKIPNWGTDILHYFVRDSFTNAGVETGAVAVVDFKEQHQGKSDQQQFMLTLRRLAPTNTYTLLSLKADETNFTEVVQFNTDARGSAMLRYKEMSNGNGKGKGKGNGFNSLPEGISDLLDLTTLAVANTSTQVVLAADLVSPDRLHYLVKRKLTNGVVGGLLQIQGTTNHTHFRLSVLNLWPSNAYWLAINETVVQTNSTDGKGRLNINTLVVPPNSPLDIKSVQLLDSNTNVLLSAELP